MQHIDIERHGTGSETIAFLHGVFMERGLWDDVIESLNDVSVVTIDMPGHGTAPALAPDLSLDDHVRAVAEAFDEMDIANVLLVGHSWGGMVALRLAHLRPDLVRGIVFSNTPLLRVRGAGRTGFGAQRLMLALGLPAGFYGRMAARALIGQGHRAAHPEDTRALALRLERMGRQTIREIIRSVLLEPGDAIELLETLPVPWTFVAGTDDYVLENGVADAIRRAGHLETVPGGHTTPLEDPTSVARAISRMRRAAIDLPA